MGNIDMRGIVFFMWVGLIAAALAVLVGIPAGLWWVWHHVSIN